MILFPSLDEALELYQKLIDEFGGSHGIRDLGLLESALYRPQTGYYEDLFSMAAALMESFLINHAFVDGNKRMAFFITDIFLRMNGYKIKTIPKTGHKFIINLTHSSSQRFETIVTWLETHCVSLRDNDA
ncbi:MAG: hypothetical protein ACD_62C00294G0003 [uncultured bacterium]|nr:MAG: hypothetical protein ACD_62C00294G0003 [uncultured bacterium]HLD44660.1 type II toxin-antitoxin system death-on-curing family toxin [bacterium]